MSCHREFAQLWSPWGRSKTAAGPLVRTFLLFAFACMLALPANSQSMRNPFVAYPMDPSQRSLRDQQKGGPIDPTEMAREVRRLQQLNAMRQKSMVSDAAKLLKLAQELNAALSDGTPSLTPEQRMHRVAEIEKLAKNVKEKMRFVTAPPEEFLDPLH